MDDSSPTLTLEELIERTNAELASQSGDEGRAPFNERTVRYYVSQGLLPKLGTRGPGARYPETFMWRLLFIRRLQRERSLTLEMVRRAMEKVSPEAMARVVRGDEPLEIAVAMDPEKRRARARAGEEIVSLSMERNESRSPTQQDLMEAGEGKDAAAYLRAARHRFDGEPSQRGLSFNYRAPQARWQRAWRDERAEIRVRGDLTDSQRRQIENLGALLKSILEN